MRRLHARFDNLIWMKLSELSRYWAAKELTQITSGENAVTFHAPFSCPDYTVTLSNRGRTGAGVLRQGNKEQELDQVSGPSKLRANSWCPRKGGASYCFHLPKGKSQLLIRQEFT